MKHSIEIVLVMENDVKSIFSKKPLKFQHCQNTHEVTREEQSFVNYYKVITIVTTLDQREYIFCLLQQEN